MPAFYAHYIFGQEVEQQLPAKYRELLAEYQELYDIGLHGPDILFFYHPIIRHPITQIGVVIHHETGREFFDHAITQIHRSAAEKEKMQKALRAYAMGAVCHLALDAPCHTYINSFEKRKHISHHEIEKELEKYLMRKDGIDPFSWDFRKVLSTNIRWARPIALFYGLQPGQIHQSVKGFLFFTRFFFRASPAKRRLVFIAMRVAGVYGRTRGFFVNKKDNPRCIQSSEALERILEENVPVAVKMIKELEYALDNDVKLSELFDRTFSGE